MAEQSVLQSFPEQDHNHTACLAQAIASAEQACAARGVRLTDLRKRVLELVWDSHAPVKAYDLLDRLRQERSGVAPPTVYRALDFLVAEGLIHRIESLNAFVGCGGPDDAGHQGQFLICRACGETAELNDPDIADVLARKAQRLGFRIDLSTVELKGLCPRCVQDSR